MQGTRPLSVVTFVIALVLLPAILYAIDWGDVFSGFYDTHMMGPYYAYQEEGFKVEDKWFWISGINTPATFTWGSGGNPATCSPQTSKYYVLLSYRLSSGSTATFNLSQGESTTINIPESATNSGVEVNIKATNISASHSTFGITCGSLFSSRATFEVKLLSSTPYCSDPDYSSAATATTVTAKNIKSQKTNSTRINLYTEGQGAGGQSSFTDVCINASNLREYTCSSDNYLRNISTICSPGYVCVSGRCASGTSSCSDSDGSNSSARGTVTTMVTASGVSRTTGIHTDTCVDGDTVQENICSGTARSTSSMNCASGFACSDGRCLAAAPVSTLEPFCTDDDDGENPDVHGTTMEGVRNSSTFQITSSTQESDVCVDETTVREFVCSGTDRTSVTRTCSDGLVCQSGACVAESTLSEAFCTDSDGGEDLAIRGTAAEGTRNRNTLEIITITEVQDECIGADNTIVREYVCEGSTRRSFDSTCPSGQLCIAGVCGRAVVPELIPFCEDSDGGDVITRRGTTREGVRNFAVVAEGEEQAVIEATDECIDSRTLWEQTCSGTDRAAVRRTCPSDMVCSDGRCIPGETPPPPPPPPPSGKNQSPIPPPPPSSDPLRAAAEESLEDAQDTLEIAVQANKNVTAAQVAIQQAEELFAQGNYRGAIANAEQAKTLAIQASPLSPVLPSPPPSALPVDPVLLAIGAGVVILFIIVAAILLYVNTRQKPPPTGSPPPPSTGASRVPPQ